MAKFILMWHPDLDDSVKAVSEQAFEKVHSLKGWQIWDDPNISLSASEEFESEEISSDEVSEDEET